MSSDASENDSSGSDSQDPSWTKPPPGPDPSQPQRTGPAAVPDTKAFFSAPSEVHHGKTLAGGPPGESQSPVVDQLGDYQLIDELGQGGMGIVYRARQRSANRIVALKIIRPTRLAEAPIAKREAAIARFHTEAEAAARIEHDHIVTVYEVGQADGQPYFSMRYVEGQSLAECLHQGPMPARRAANYIRQAALGLHAAHQRGILHRDLKPQNILIDQQNDRALITDFGLAKLVEHNEELTQAGEVMGTPQYMSPEQARDSANVSIQSDVYALGATLYHLIVGRPAFHAATPLETLRQVLEASPVRPCQLNPALDRDLETICLKCLEKDPPRRYPSAEAVSAELSRYLDGRPIQARPISWLERTWRWSRRNRLVASLSLCAIVCVLGLLLVTSVAYFSTSAAQRRSEQSFHQALDMVNVFFTRVSQETLLDQPGLQPLRQDLLVQARQYYQLLLSQRTGDPTIEDRLAATHYRVGLITAEIDSPELAIASYDRALKIQRRMADDEPQEPRHLNRLADTLNAKAKALFEMKQLAESLNHFDQSNQLRVQLVRAAPDHPEYQRKLANTQMNIGILLLEQNQPDKARGQFESAQAVREQLHRNEPSSPNVLRDLAKGYYNLSSLLMSIDQFEQAQQHAQQAIQLFTELLRLQRTIDDRYRLDLCYVSLARLQDDSADERAISIYLETLDRLTRLSQENPSLDKLRATIARVYMELGDRQFRAGEAPQARQSLKQAQTILTDLVRRDPHTSSYPNDLLQAISWLAEMHQASTDEVDLLDRQLQQLAPLVESFPDLPQFRKRQVEIQQQLDSLRPAKVE